MSRYWGLQPFDIVAYQYRAHIYTPAEIVDALIADGLASPAARDMDVEDALDQIAGANAIDRMDEYSFDSDDFPKVVFRNHYQEGDLDQQNDLNNYEGRRRTSRMYHHPYDESGQWTSESVDLQVGDRFSTVAPYSEVMMHMDLAGKPIEVEILSEQAVQIYVDGKPHSFPVTPGEAGIYRQGRRKKSAADVPRPIYMIADDIRRDWRNINFAAAPYLDAMMHMSSLSDSYYNDSAETVVIYFLENARSWSGDSAKSIKAELRAMLKAHQKNGARRNAQGRTLQGASDIFVALTTSLNALDKALYDAEASVLNGEARSHLNDARHHAVLVFDSVINAQWAEDGI